MIVAHTPFRAFENGTSHDAIIALDIGYSSKRKSCGVACSGYRKFPPLHFGGAVTEVHKLCVTHKTPLLVIEAPLSTYHRPDGNPDLRGDFEAGRGWYWGPGAVALLAAMRFLQVLGQKLRGDQPVFLAEAFLSNKPDRTEDLDDAAEIASKFRAMKPEVLRVGVEPISGLVSGVPSVRVFKPREKNAR